MVEDEINEDQTTESLVDKSKIIELELVSWCRWGLFLEGSSSVLGALSGLLQAPRGSSLGTVSEW